MKIRIITREDFNKMTFNKVTIVQLKATLRSLNIKFKSNLRKKDFYDLLKNYYYSDNYNEQDINKIRIIQNRWKKKYSNKNLKRRGIGYFNRDLCTNDTEFFSLENIKDISDENFISFIDESKKVYGFDIFSLIEMFEENVYTNPYTCIDFPQSFIINVQEIHKKIKNNQKIISLIKMTPEEKLNDRIFNFFHKCYLISGNFVNDQWFKDLNRIELIDFYKGVEDIWNYRAQLTPEVKQKYVPSNVEIFNKIPEVSNPKNSLETIKNILLDDFEKFISLPEKEDDKITTTMWILTAFVDVSQIAQINLPQLIQVY